MQDLLWTCFMVKSRLIQFYLNKFWSLVNLWNNASPRVKGHLSRRSRRMVCVQIEHSSWPYKRAAIVHWFKCSRSSLIRTTQFNLPSWFSQKSPGNWSSERLRCDISARSQRRRSELRLLIPPQSTVKDEIHWDTFLISISITKCPYNEVKQISLPISCGMHDQ